MRLLRFLTETFVYAEKTLFMLPASRKKQNLISDAPMCKVNRINSWTVPKYLTLSDLYFNIADRQEFCTIFLWLLNNCAQDMNIPNFLLIFDSGISKLWVESCAPYEINEVTEWPRIFHIFPWNCNKIAQLEIF